jgi:hypothetical protein
MGVSVNIKHKAKIGNSIYNNKKDRPLTVLFTLNKTTN